MESKHGWLYLNAANIITFCRFFFLALYVHMIYEPTTWLGVENGEWWFLVAFFLLAASDFADGAVARMLKVSSKFGRLIDPWVDKVILGTLLLTMHDVGGAPIAVVVVVMIREIFSTQLRTATEIFSEKEGITSIFGKIKTAAYSFAIHVYFLVSIATDVSHQKIQLYTLAVIIGWAALFLMMTLKKGEFTFPSKKNTIVIGLSILGGGLSLAFLSKEACLFCLVYFALMSIGEYISYYYKDVIHPWGSKKALFLWDFSVSSLLVFLIVKGVDIDMMLTHIMLASLLMLVGLANHLVTKNDLSVLESESHVAIRYMWLGGTVVFLCVSIFTQSQTVLMFSTGLMCIGTILVPTHFVKMQD